MRRVVTREMEMIKTSRVKSRLPPILPVSDSGKERRFIKNCPETVLSF